MMISEGEALPFSCLPCQKIHALFRVVTPVREYLQQLLRAGGRIATELEAVAEMLGVSKVVVC